MKKINLIILLFYFLIIISCNSHLSNGKVDDITLIGATIEITQNPFDSKVNGITIDLFDDKGNIIRNDSIKIIVNNVEKSLSHKQGLYYDDESEYYLETAPVNQMYKVDVKLTNGEKYFLGSINALAEEKNENIECEEQGDLNKNTVIKWKNLKSIDELSVYTMTLLKTSNFKNKNYYPGATINKKISNNGEYVISKSEYFNPKWTVTSFNFKFSTTKFGKTNPKLLENSKISISTSIEKYINLEKEEIKTTANSGHKKWRILLYVDVCVSQEILS